MKKIVSKELLVSLFITILTIFTTNAQRNLIPIIDDGGDGSVTITGNTNVNINDTETYYALHSQGLSIYEANWSITGGTILSQSISSVTVKWTTAGTGRLYYLVSQSNMGTIKSTFIVSVTGTQTPNPPQNPEILSQDCTSAVLESVGTPPLGDLWYWQGTNSNGISTNHPATNNYVVTTTGMYYIRARNTGTGVWSVSSGYIKVTLGGLGGNVWYADLDLDGLGDANNTKIQCTQPVNYVSNNDDLCPNEYGQATNNGCPIVNGISNENYIYNIIPQIAVSDVSQITENKQALKNITYFDALGRPIQKIGIKQSNTERDIITHIEYDSFGRQNKNYLPYVPSIEGGDGSYRPNALAATNDFYNTAKYENTTNPYAEKHIEASPLNRVFELGAPGGSWSVDKNSDIDHTIKFDYKTNTTTNEVRLYTVSLTSDFTPTLVSSSYFANNTLYKTITKSEDWKTTDGINKTMEEFKDKLGRLILKRSYNSNQKHDTYYVYDNYGNLTYVLPPNSEATFDKPSSTELSKLCYQYIYDKLNRLIKKKIPGKDWEYIVYDRLDRPVLVQDGNQRAKSPNEWLFTKYDVFGRVVYTGIYSSNTAQSTLQIIFNNKSATENYETKVTTGSGYDNSYYTNNNFPNADIEILTVNYYDDYNFNLAGSFNPVTNPFEVYDRTTSTSVKSLTTGTKVKVLNESPEKWITTITYYDIKAVPIYIYTQNDYLETTDIVKSKLDFVGKVEEMTTMHTYIGDNLPTITTIDTYTYDHVGRLKKQTQTLGGHIETIVANTYDELGQLEIKKVGNTEAAPLQTINYTYTVRGWLKNINQDNNNDNDLFNFTLMYNDIADTTKKLYNGNISQMSWNTLNTDSGVKTYSYTYDELNRITSAIDDTADNRYSLTNVSYDKNGNILNLIRNGHTDVGVTNFGTMDNLSYYYNGNQLHSVSDSSGKMTGFNDGNSSDAIYDNGNDDYTYDVNGNLKTDKNKGITNINYNHLNLPVQLTINGQNITYIYDATGVKLRKIISNTTTDYAGNYVYENNNLQFFNHAEGYITTSGSFFKYVYQYKDHLGNIRLSYTDKNQLNNDAVDLEIIEENNYYPFGLKHKGYNTYVSANGNSLAQKRKFGSNELQEELGLEWYDITARNYDPSIGRWMNLDPLAESMRRFSPYNYAFDNPIMFIDPDGMEPVIAEGIGHALSMVNDQKDDDRIGKIDKVEEDLSLNKKATKNDPPNKYQLFFRNELKKLEAQHGKYYDTEGYNGFENFTSNVYDGTVDGLKSTGNGIKSLGTKEGWKNLVKGIANFGAMGNPTDAYGAMLRAQTAINVSNFINRVPNMSYGELGYYTGFGIVKAWEAAIFSKGAGSIKSGVGLGIGDLRFFSNTTIRGTTLFKTGKNFRIDFDFKNFLHYHRRGPGGIGRHRPWQVKPGDKGIFKKRF